MAPSIRPIVCSATAASSRCIAGSSSAFSATAARSISTTSSLSRQMPSHRTVDAEAIAEYPYGRYRWYKQRNEGMYGSASIRYGNIISEKWNRKSTAQWLPNRQVKRVWSVSLQNFIRVRMTPRVLRTIDKLGGIDEYLLGNKAMRIKELGPAGWRLRWKVLQSPAMQQRFALERQALGLPPKAVLATGVLEVPAELQAEADKSGQTPQQLMDEVDNMLANEEEFVLGDGAEVSSFMEEKEMPKRP